MIRMMQLKPKTTSQASQNPQDTCAQLAHPCCLFLEPELTLPDGLSWHAPCRQQVSNKLATSRCNGILKMTRHDTTLWQQTQQTCYRLVRDLLREATGKLV